MSPMQADPIMLAREQIKADIAVTVKELSVAQRITLFDLLSADMENMAEELGLEEEAHG